MQGFGHPAATVLAAETFRIDTTTARQNLHVIFPRASLNAKQIRLSVTLEDLTVYVAQRSDKERESVIRQLSAPVDGVKEKLGQMEETLAGFQRTMHLVLGEVDADRERSATIAVRIFLRCVLPYTFPFSSTPKFMAHSWWAQGVYHTCAAIRRSSLDSSNNAIRSPTRGLFPAAIRPRTKKNVDSH